MGDIAQMNEYVLNIPLHPKQKQIYLDKARFKIVASGRRFGKTWLAAYDALRHVFEDPITKEEVYDAVVWVVAPRYSQSMILWRKILEILPYGLVNKINRTDKFIEFVNGSKIWCKSADNPDSLRGEGIDFLIVDEAAMVKKEAWENALRPALADKHGSALFISTPKGKNWFYELFLRGIDEEQQQYKSWRYPSWENPFLSREEIEELRRTLPELTFKQEIEAEFIEGGGTVFRNIHNCVVGELEAPTANKTYVVGVDLAKYEDFTVLVVIDVEKRHVVHFERFNKIDWGYQKAKIAEVARRYNNARIIIDSTGVGDPIYEDLVRAGLNVEGFKFTNQTKSQLIQNLMLKIEQQQISFPQINELLLELQAFTYEITQTGSVRYQAPAGFHDDCVIALALAVYGAESTLPNESDWEFY